jgi:hypothetical protein
MLLKSYIRPILQMLRHVVPFYWVTNISSKFEQLNSDRSRDEISINNRKPHDYEKNDVNNEIRAAIRLGALLIGMTIGFIAIGVLFFPIVGPLFTLLLDLIVGIGIIPGLFDYFAKQAIRFFSWCNTKNDPEIINKTYPQKYKVNPGPEDLFPTAFSQDQCRAINDAIQEGMRIFYTTKQHIKNNPEGWFGLSKQQKENCSALNIGIGLFRRRAVLPFYVDFFVQQKIPLTPRSYITNHVDCRLSNKLTNNERQYLLTLLP